MEKIINALNILEKFVFPLKESCDVIFGSSCETSNYQSIVSLHEKNGFCIGGLPVSKDILQISSITIQNPNIEMIKRYLLNLDYINFEICKGSNKNSLVIKLESDRYHINKLQKDFSYDEYPSEDEMKNLLKALFLNPYDQT